MLGDFEADASRTVFLKPGFHGHDIATRDQKRHRYVPSSDVKVIESLPVSRLFYFTRALVPLRRRVGDAAKIVV